MERVAWDLAKRLQETVDIQFVTSTVPSRPTHFTHEGIPVRALRTRRPGRYSVRWWLATCITKTDPGATILSVGGGATLMSWIRGGRRYIFQAHGTSVNEFRGAITVRARLWRLKAVRFAVWTFIDAFTYRWRASVVVACSDHVERSLQRWPYRAAWDRTSLHAIPNGVDVLRLRTDGSGERERPSGDPRSAVTVLTLSRLDRQKGIDRAIDAVAASRGLRLLVVGDGPERSALERQVLSRDIASRVEFRGSLNRDDLRLAFAEVDCLVYPVRGAEREGMPLAVLEALASGLQVIVPKGSQWQEPLPSYFWFADVDCAVSLAEAIHRAVRYARAVPAGVIDGFSLEVMARRYTEVFTR